MEPDSKPPGADKPKSKGVWLPLLINGLLVLLMALSAHADVAQIGQSAANDTLGLNVLVLALGNFFALLYAIGQSKTQWAAGFSISLFLLLLIGSSTCGRG